MCIVAASSASSIAAAGAIASIAASSASSIAAAGATASIAAGGSAIAGIVAGGWSAIALYSARVQMSSVRIAAGAR